MKLFRHFFMTMLTLAVCTGFVACGDDDDETDEPGGGNNPSQGTTTPDNLIGVWEFSYEDEDGEDGSMTITFKHNGICTLNFDDESVGFGSCTASGSSLKLDFGIMTFNGSYSLQGNKLHYDFIWHDLDYPDEDMEMSCDFVKTSSNPGFEPDKVTSDIVGVWDSEDGDHTLSFLSNGLMKYVQHPGGEDHLDHIEVYMCYAIDGNRLKLRTPLNNNWDENESFGRNTTFSVSGNTLIITAGNADGSPESMHLTRVK